MCILWGEKSLAFVRFQKSRSGSRKSIPNEGLMRELSSHLLLNAGNQYMYMGHRLTMEGLSD